MSNPSSLNADPWISADGFKVAALLTGGDKRAGAPTLTIVAGQMGSGKTVAIKGVLDNLPEGEAWSLIDGDALHQTHERYSRTEAEKGTAYAKLETQKHAGLWAERLKDDAIRSRRHVAIEVASADADVAAIAMAYAVEGYRTRLIVLAVPEHVSRQAIVGRELEERRHKGHGRHVTSADHDRAYARWPIALAAQLRRMQFDAIEVASPNRDAAGTLTTLARAEKVRPGPGAPARWSKDPAELLTALVKERTAPLTPLAIARHEGRWSVLADTLPLGRRHALDQQALKDTERLSSSAPWRHQREGRLVVQAVERGEDAEHVTLNALMMRTAPRERAPTPQKPKSRGLFGISL